MLLRSRTGGVGILDLSWPILRPRTFAFVAPDDVPDQLQLSAANTSESNPGPLLLINPGHNTGHFDSKLPAGKPERQTAPSSPWCKSGFLRKRMV